MVQVAGGLGAALHQRLLATSEISRPGLANDVDRPADLSKLLATHQSDDYGHALV